jgi:hypothetical protein
MRVVFWLAWGFPVDLSAGRMPAGHPAETQMAAEGARWESGSLIPGSGSTLQLQPLASEARTTMPRVLQCDVQVHAL